MRALHKLEFFLIVILLVPVTSISQGTWEKFDIPTQLNLTSLSFTDSLVGWLVGDSGVIVHTSDGGQTWEIQQSNTTNNIVNVFFLNNNIGWATSHSFSSLPYGTLLLKTADGGMNWDTISYPETNVFIESIFFLDSLTGWMGGTPHALVSTNDAGNSWHQAEIDTSTLAFFPVLNIEFYNEQYGYASGGIFDIAGVIWRTSDGGQNWYAIDVEDAPADEVHGLYMFDSVNVIGSGGDPDFGFGVGFTRTNNGGITWEYDEIGIQGIAFDVDFVNNKEGWAPLGYENKYVYTVDTGRTWTPITTPEQTSIFDIVFTDSLHGYAVGSEGAFLRFKPQTPVSVSNIIFEDHIKLFQNYPNPFSSSTTIRFEYNGIGSVSPVYVSIFDIMGNEVERIISKKMTDGSYLALFTSSQLPGGIYYYRIISNAVISEVKSMILVN